MYRNQRIGVLIGPLFILASLLFSNLPARIQYAGAPEVRMTVLVADYEHNARGTQARIITFEGPPGSPPVPLDNLFTAPDGLVPGATVTVLTRSGRAILPSQLGWSQLLIPGAFFLLGILVTVAGVLAFRDSPPPPRTDPEAWD